MGDRPGVCADETPNRQPPLLFSAHHPPPGSQSPQIFVDSLSISFQQFPTIWLLPNGGSSPPSTCPLAPDKTPNLILPKNTQAILDFSQPEFNVALLDQVVTAFYSGSGQQVRGGRDEFAERGGVFFCGFG